MPEIRHPALSAKSLRIDSIVGWFTELSRREAILLSVGATLIVYLAAVVTPERFTFGPLYFLLVCIAAWTVGNVGGYVTAIATAVLWMTQFGHSGEPAAVAWNMLSRGAIQVIIAAMIAAMRRTYDREHSLARIDGLTGALNRGAFHEAISAIFMRRSARCSTGRAARAT